MMEESELCPSEDTVVQFLTGCLGDREVVRLEQHASGCLACMELLTTAARLSPDGTSPDSLAENSWDPGLLSGVIDPDGAGVSEAAAVPERIGPYRVLARL